MALAGLGRLVLFDGLGVSRRPGADDALAGGGELAHRPAWLFKDAAQPALVYGPLAFVGVICVISMGFVGRRLEQRMGDGANVMRINHAGGLLLGLLIGAAVWLLLL